MTMLQVVLLFGSKTWVLTPRLEKALGGFYHQAAQRMAGMGPKHQGGGMWVYPSIGEELAMVGLKEIGLYIACHHKTVAQYITTHPIVDLYLAAERNLGMPLFRRCWD